VLLKQHLQILRTREEALHMRMKNATLSFQVRQLQAEIFRLLPFSKSHVPSTEYHMSLDHNLYHERPATLTIEADAEHTADLEALHKCWVELTEIQDQVFAEEKQKNEEDTQQWNEFARDFKTQNHDAHKMIDLQLADITRKLIFLRSQHGEMVNGKNEQLEALNRKVKRLRATADTTIATVSEKTTQERNKTLNETSKQCGVVRGRVREIERKNLARFSAMKEIDNELQQHELALLRETDKLTERLTALTRKNEGLVADGNAKIASLEEQLNAVISAAAAVKDMNDAEEERILNAVGGAVGRHGSAVHGFEQLKLEIQNMGARLEEAAGHFECP
jgi:uncharacterized protein YoxC